MRPFSEETISKIPIPDTIDDWMKTLKDNEGNNESSVECEQGSEYLYDLCNVVIHSGDAGGGHYHCYTKDLMGEGVCAVDSEKQVIDSKWFDFNDSNVSSITIDKILSQYGGNEFGKHKNECAYMAIYRKSNLAVPKTMEIPVHLQEGIVLYNKDLEKKRIEWNANEAQRIKDREAMKLPGSSGYNTFGLMKRTNLQGRKREEGKEEVSDEEVNVDGVDDLFEGFGNLEISPTIPTVSNSDNFFFAPKMQFETEPLPDIVPDAENDEEEDIEEMESVVAKKKKIEIGQVAKKTRPIGIGKNKNRAKKATKFTERSQRKNRVREYDPETKTTSKDREGSFSLSEAQTKKRVVFERSLKIQVGDDEYEWVSCSSSEEGEENNEAKEVKKEEKEQS